MSEQEIPEKDTAGVPFSSDDAEEQRLWIELQHLPQAMPSPRLRRKFYDELDRMSRLTWVDRSRHWLGLSGTAGLLTATGCLVVGLGIGLLLNRSASGELAAFQHQLATLNRSLILDRLENDSSSKRLLGVIDAVGVAEHDAEVARALLARAIDDRVYSVRSAAIDAIGSRVSTPSVGDELMASLEKTESPLTQLALVDLVLRHGNGKQLEQLLRLCEHGALHPDVVQHVKSSVWRNRT